MQKSQDPEFNTPSNFVGLSTLVYYVLLGLGLTIMHFHLGSREEVLHFFKRTPSPEIFYSTIALTVLTLVTSSWWLELQFPSYRATKKIFAELFQGCSMPTLFYLAVISGIAEEVFFRGALVPLIGVVPAAIIFGLTHIGPVGGIGLWTLWATVAGLLFGYIFESQGNLLVVIVAHVIVNLIGFTSIKKMQSKASRDEARNQLY